MIKLITSLLLITFLILTGQIIQGIKKLIKLFLPYILKLLRFFGIEIKDKTEEVKVSQEFKETYKEIKIVKLSKKNNKQISCIDWNNVIIVIIVGLLILINMKFISNQAISNFLFSLIKWTKFIKSENDMSILYTSSLTSVLTFALGNIWSRWKNTKQQRIERKESRLREQAIKLMDSKYLLEQAKKKNEQKYKEVKGE